MKELIFVLVFFLGSYGVVWADTVGDVNNDGQVGLEEAVYALQVTSGMKTETSADSQTYDMNEYMEQAGCTYYYREVEYASGEVRTGVGVDSFAIETVNEQTVLALTDEAGMWAGDVDYYVIGDAKIEYLGYKWGGDETYYDWYNPPIVIGLRSIKTGDKITNMFTNSYNSIRYREYTFLGLENVTVSAGTFNDCIKILQKRSYKGRCNISYKAKGIGTVKNIRSDASGNGYFRELVNVKKADGTYISDNTICSVQGTWAADGMTPNSGSLSMAYISQNLPIYTSVTLSGLNTFYLKSSDGSNFSPDPQAYSDDDYDGQPDLSSISITVTNDQISGNYYHTDWQGNTFEVSLNGTLSCE